ncbi:MAG: beta-glucosidase [Rhodovulum sulfidophilum]|uniref:Beta-glucosidase n=1 Tax=Rhodovulum sulfidophilum TaxID=35806 RepID=A0A2W5MZM7_RHOSU|nr:MAG: beta-glucosidase [Rhodovulum sulfidophilum]
MSESTGPGTPSGPAAGWVPAPGDAALLDLTQARTLGYFWDFAHPVSGLARERSNVTPRYGLETVTTGGSGFGVMAILVGVSRGWIARDAAVERLWTMTRFLEKAASFHGVWPHFLNGETGRAIPFSRKDDGGDLVETSFLIAGLLCARQFFDADDPAEARLRALITWLWEEVEWSWHTRDGRNVLHWHWSPNNGWSMNHEIRGWNECLITYVLAASAPRYPITPDVYHRGWAEGRDFLNGRAYDGITLPLGPEGGGPLFLSQYSFLGLDPRGLRDRYADYWAQNVAQTRINRAHCLRNPGGFEGYGPGCWGLSACDGPDGYDAFSPTNDRGVIAPSAALSAFPYAPEEAMAALRHFHGALGDRIWRAHGFVDAFDETRGWVAPAHLAIDQGPIVVMIENARTGLIWKLLMSCPEIRIGLRRLGFESPWLGAAA